MGKIPQDVIIINYILFFINFFIRNYILLINYILLRNYILLIFII